MDGSDQRTENSNSLQNSCGGAASRDLAPRHLTAFQLLQSKFMRSSSKAPVTHQREVGTLSSSRGRDWKNSKSDDPEPKSQARRGQGQKRGDRVKDIVAKFAMAEHKEKGETALKSQPLKPRMAGRGTVLSSLMERFETLATVRRGSAGKQVRLPGDVKQMVACGERRQRRRGEDQDVHKQNQPRNKRVEPGLGGHRSSSEQGAGPSTPQIKSHPGKNHLKHSHQKPEDRCSTEARKHLTCSKTDKNSVQHGEKQSRPEEANITARLKYGRLMVLNLRSVTETFLPEPSQLVPQVEAQMKCHVGTIITSSPVWYTGVDHSPGPELHPAEPPETTVQPSDGAMWEKGSWLNPQSEEENRGAEGDDLNLPESRTGQKSGPAYLIPRVNRFAFPQDAKEHARSSQLPAADSEKDFLNVAQPYWDSSDPGLMACPPSNTEELIVQITIKDTEMEEKHHSQEGKTKELIPVVTEDTNTQLSEETKAKATSGGTSPAVSSPEGHREADDQKLRPKYKTINYGDPSVKETYKPKIIRFTDTFTF